MFKCSSNSLRRSLTCVLVASAIGIAGCGEDGSDAGNEPKPLRGGTVERSVSRVFDICIGEAYKGDDADTSAVSVEIDRQIRWFKDTPDARFVGPTGLKARSMRGILQNMRDVMRNCAPEEVERIGETLTSK